MAYDYYASGANDEVTLRENRAAYERITLLPRVLVDGTHTEMALSKGLWLILWLRHKLAQGPFVT